MTYQYPQGGWALGERRPNEPVDGPAEKAPHGLWPDRFSLVFGAVVAAATLVALVLGIIAPALGPGTAPVVPSGWTTVFDGAPRDDGTWGNGSGCAFVSTGMDVTDASGNQPQVCRYNPSATSDLTSQGFAVEVQLAPAAKVQGNQRPLISVGGDADGGFVTIDQNGMYTLCRYSQDSQDSTCLPTSTVAWHGDSYVSNTLAVRYLPDTGGGGSLVFFANGQEVTTLAMNLNPGAAFGIGADANSEALITHVAVYSASS